MVSADVHDIFWWLTLCLGSFFYWTKTVSESHCALFPIPVHIFFCQILNSIQFCISKNHHSHDTFAFVSLRRLKKVKWQGQYTSSRCHFKLNIGHHSRPLVSYDFISHWHLQPCCLDWPFSPSASLFSALTYDCLGELKVHFILFCRILWLILPDLASDLLGRAHPTKMGNKSRAFWVIERTREHSGGKKEHLLCLLCRNITIANQAAFTLSLFPQCHLLASSSERHSSENLPWISLKIKVFLKLVASQDRNSPLHFKTVWW